MTVGDEFEQYYSGKKLYGNDFNMEQLTQWYEEEAEGYAGLSANSDRSKYAYMYHAMDQYYGFSRLPNRHFRAALGIGSAYGEEFRPIASRLRSITILDPSVAFITSEIESVPVTYEKPEISGTISCCSGSFDLVLCLSALHHVANVSHVVSEIGRVLVADGYALIREPVVSMGDWRKPRVGVTRQERGIPRHLMRGFFLDAGLEVMHEYPCDFRPLSFFLRKVAGIEKFNSPFFTTLDHVVSRAFEWNMEYKREAFMRKFAPSACYWVLRATGRSGPPS